MEVRRGVGVRWRTATLLCAAVGCASSNGPSGPLSPSSRPYLADIPLPEGFTLADRSSEDWSARTIRFVRHRYLGRGDRQAARAFYRRQMPLVRWTPICESSANGRHELSFRRAKETCRITIDGRGRGPRNALIIEALIAPDPGGAGSSGS
jgi:hypothetical protein